MKKGAQGRRSDGLIPQARAVLDELSAAGFDGGEPRSLEDMRRQQVIEARFFGEPEPVKTVRDVHVDRPGGRIGVRLYVRGCPEGSDRHNCVAVKRSDDMAQGKIRIGVVNEPSRTTRN